MWKTRPLTNDVAYMPEETVWKRVSACLKRGNFTDVRDVVRGGDESLTDMILSNGADDELREEAFACACFLGLNGDVESLLDLGVDPAAGNRSGQTGFHYAAMSGRLDTVRLLLDRGAPLEAVNQYGSTVLGQTLWSAVHEGFPSHPAIIEALIAGGAHVDERTVSWWAEQDGVPSDAGRRIGAALARGVVR